MTTRDGGARTALNGPATGPTVADTDDGDREQRRAEYSRREHPKFVRALDRHIVRAYGSEHLRRWA